jgi:vacuolar-type H+-ATPase subunit E/Vma4
MALADLLQTLEREATTRADARLAAARAEVERLAAAHAAELAAHREQALAGRQQALRADGERSIVAAGRSAEMTRLVARHEFLARAHDCARGNLARHADTAEGRMAVVALVARALTYLGDAPVHARATPQLVATVRTACAAWATVEVAGASQVGTGARFAAADGSIEVDATLEGVLERLWPELAMDIVRRAESL